MAESPAKTCSKSAGVWLVISPSAISQPAPWRNFMGAPGALCAKLVAVSAMKRIRFTLLLLKVAHDIPIVPDNIRKSPAT
jgi:hypothetical protein